MEGQQEGKHRACAQYAIAARQTVAYLWHILPLHFGLFQRLVGILKVSQAPQTAVEQPKGRLAVSIVVPQEVCQLQVLVRGDPALKLLHRWGQLSRTSQTFSCRSKYCKPWCGACGKFSQPSLTLSFSIVSPNFR